MLGWLFLNRAFLFAWAAVTGFLFALVWKQYEQTVHRTLTHYRITPSSFDYQWAYEAWLSGLGLSSVALLRANNGTRVEPNHAAKTSSGSPIPPPVETIVTEDKWLANRVPVFCVILSRKLKQTRAVKQTWAKHCDGVAFYGSFADRSIPVKKVADEGSGDGYNVQCVALRETWRQRRHFRWVLVATDRTYAVVENLRYMVAGLDSNESHYLGHAFHDYDGNFNVEDAGYVLSWGALQAFNRRFDSSSTGDATSDEDAEDDEDDRDECRRHEFWSSGDRTVGKALQELGVRPRDTRDTLERSRFLPFSLDKLLIPGSISVFNRYWRESVFLSPEGSGCCSDFAVTFSDVSPDKMSMMEYIIYHLKPVSHRWPPPSIEPVAAPVAPATLSTTTATTTKRVTPTAGKAFVSELTAITKNSPVASAIKTFPSEPPALDTEVDNEVDESEVLIDAAIVDVKSPPASDDEEDSNAAKSAVVNGHGEPRDGATDSNSPKGNSYDVVREDEYFDDFGEGKDKDGGAKN